MVLPVSGSASTGQVLVPSDIIYYYIPSGNGADQLAEGGGAQYLPAVCLAAMHNGRITMHRLVRRRDA